MQLGSVNQDSVEQPASRYRKYFNRYTLTLVATMLMLLLGAVLMVRSLNPPTYALTMTTGNFSGANYALATRYLDPEAQAHRVELSWVQTGGSEDTLDAVQQGRVQVAIANGGLSHTGRENVREVAPLFLTAMHLLVRREIYDQVMETRDLRATLRGKTVSLSNEGSGTRTFAIDVLNRLGISTSEFTETPRSVDYLTNPRNTAEQIPEIVFAASLLPSPVAARLVRDFDYRLYPLDFVDAARLDDKAIYGVTIPAGTYGLSPDVPEKSVVTLGRRLLLVAHKDVPADAVTAMARAVFDGDFAKVYDPPLTTKHFDLLPEYPRHPGAQAYLTSHAPITQESLAGLFQYVGVLGAVACIPPCIIMMRPYLRRRRPGSLVRSVRHYIIEVSELEVEAYSLDESAPSSYGHLLGIRRRLNQLKLATMAAYKDGNLDDADLMDSFLAHVGDLRSHLNALIQSGYPAEAHSALGSIPSAFQPPASRSSEHDSSSLPLRA